MDNFAESIKDVSPEFCQAAGRNNRSKLDRSDPRASLDRTAEGGCPHTSIAISLPTPA
jgi:hypothetical protein